MKFKKLLLPIFSLIFCSSFLSAPVHASTQDFYFKSFDADYYLEKDEEGVSHLRVEETLVAVFPESNQNHGIDRVIPFINQDGKNITLENLNNKNLTVTRNGNSEPFTVSKSSATDYTVRIGSASSYVHGEQKYKLSYTFDKVIAEFPDSLLQELYWDTNGTGWYQKFDELTATVHMPKDIIEKWNKKPSCYVGNYGEKGSERCKIEYTDDGIIFKTSNLRPQENLTFDLEFEKGTFTIPAPKTNYTAIIIIATNIILIIGIIALNIYTTKKARANKKFYKSIFVAPEYLPIGDESLHLYALISIKQLRSADVATLIQLAVQKKIQLEKIEKKSIFSGEKWKIHILSTDDLKKEEQTVLELLNNVKPVSAGDIIEIKTNYSSTAALRLQKETEKHTKSTAKVSGLYEEIDKKVSSRNILIRLAIYAIWFFVSYNLGSALDSISIIGQNVPLKDEATMSIVMTFLSFFVIEATFTSIYGKYKHSTEKSLKLARRLEGLELYIKMAEKDRIEFLQSVKNVDTSHQGIVNLYEKLLPYAILFGCEKSWMSELEKYYKFDDVTDTYWLIGTHHMIYRDFAAFQLSSSSAIRSVSPSSSSNTSSSSSGFSGGGGGGFSGGGGGGGGGGGW